MNQNVLRCMANQNKVCKFSSDARALFVPDRDIREKDFILLDVIFNQCLVRRGDLRPYHRSVRSDLGSLLLLSLLYLLSRYIYMYYNNKYNDKIESNLKTNPEPKQMEVKDGDYWTI